MAKRLQITDSVAAKINKAAGAEVDTSKLAVFECVALNTMPLNKEHTIFHKARHQRSQLDAMVAYLNDNSVPVHTLHKMGEELPVGKVFDAGVFPSDNGEWELRAQFYMDAEDERVSKIENGMLDEVSVSVKHQRLECSECGWNYLGDDSSIMNLIEKTCANDHTLGKDGVVLRLVGMERWFETSLVSKGAAHKPKIVSRAKALLGNEQFQRLAAHGVSPDLTILTASVVNNSKDKTMDLAQLVAMNSEQAVKLADAVRVKDEVTAKLTAAEAAVAELTAKVAELSKDNGVAEKIAGLEQTIASFTDAGSFLIEQAKLAQVAAGKSGDAVVTPKDAAEAVAILKECKAALHTIPVDGVAKPSDAGDLTKANDSARFMSFKTPKAA